MEPKAEPVNVVLKRSSADEQIFAPSSCPVESVSEVYEPKRAESTTDVRRPTKPWAKKPAHSRTHVSVVTEALLGVPGEHTRMTQRSLTSSQKETELSDPSQQWGGGVRSGHYLSMNDDFETVESPYGNDSHTAEALMKCKKTVLYPYLTFQKLIGWRCLYSGSRDLEVSKFASCVNVIYPSVFFVILVYTSVAQLLTCYFRTDAVSSTNNSITCREKIVTLVILSDGVLLAVYLWGVYLFLYLEPEYLSSLMEKVFISCTSSASVLHGNRLIYVLQVTLFSGVVWISFSFMTSVMRLFSLRLLGDNTVIDWLTTSYQIVPEDYDARRYILVISALFGFVFFDFLYISVVIYYVSQGELVIYLVKSIKEKVRNKLGTLGDAIKDIRYTHSILHIFNGQLSAMTSLCLFIFVVNTVTSYKNLLEVPRESKLAYTVGVFNMIQWSVIIVVPVCQAARLTRECCHLKRLGLEIAARPYTYSDTPQKELDSFLIYTNATNYTAKLVGVSIYPKYIVFGLFVFGLFLSFYKFPLTPWF